MISNSLAIKVLYVGSYFIMALLLQSEAKDLRDQLDKMAQSKQAVEEKYQQALKELEQYKVCCIATYITHYMPNI